MANHFKTALLMAALTALIVVFGNVFGGRTGMYWALGLAVAMNFGAYWFSDKIVLASYRAQEISERDDPRLYAIVRGLASRASLPMPRVYVIPSQGLNAFATGRDPAHAVVAVTQGLRSAMNEEELTGVLAHELGHVMHRDILISAIAASLAGAVMVLASMARWAAIFGIGGRDEEGGSNNIVAVLAMAILAPVAATLIQMAISRSREYAADAEAARLTRNPLGLAAALSRLGQAARQLPMGEAKPATAHLFIVNPLSGQGLMNLFSTHPPLTERIARLREMAGRA